MNRRILLTQSLVLGAAALVPETAWAFRPSAKWVLGQATGVRYRLGIRSLKIDAETLRFDLDERGLQAEEHTWILSPSSFRREISRPDGQDLVLVTKKKKRLETSEAKKTLKRRPDFLVDFLTMGEPMQRSVASERLMKALKAINVDEEVVSYGRHDGRVMYIVGAKSFETDKSSVWIDKDSLQLSRIIEVSKGKSAKVAVKETRLIGYGSPEGGSWWPKTIEVLQGDEVQRKLLSRTTTLLVEKNPALKKSLFALPK
ncbi:MAG: hypothetical protein GY822_01190 [Deltaproteobacteria bacterium]|nr:hypothetical protein [Deltaproteobacteria bacterium]